MQRIEVNFNGKEYFTIKKWIKGEYAGIEEIEKEIFIKDEEEKVLFNFSKVNNNEVLLKIKSNKGYLINNETGKGLKEITFDKISKVMGVFSLSKKYLNEEILIRFTKQYEYHKSYKEYKQSELNTIMYFTKEISTHNLFNCIKYFDFGDKEYLSLAIYLYINYVYNYDKVAEVEELTKNKLEILGYERNIKLKDKRPVYEGKDVANLKRVSSKSLNYAFENLLEVFYKLISSNIKSNKLINGDIEDDMQYIEEYSYALIYYYVGNIIM